MNYELGLLIDGFDSPPTFMMTYNPPYYARLIENYGFRKTQDLYAFWGHVDMLPKIGQKLRPDRRADHRALRRQAAAAGHVAVSRRRGDVSVDLQPLAGRTRGASCRCRPTRCGTSAGGLRHIIVPEMTVAAGDRRPGGRRGSFGLPDYNPRIKEIDGRLFPFGFIHLLRNRQAIKRIRLISTNVLPEYQRMGMGLVLMHGLVPKAIEWGLQEAEFSWVLESNSLSYGALKKGGAKITKTYRLYDFEGREERGEGRGNAEGGTRNETLPVQDSASSVPRSSSLSPLHSSSRPSRSPRSPRPRATSTGSSNCRGGSMPRIRIGCRRC